MTNEELCLQWHQFLEGHDEGVVFKDEMLDHIEACDTCQGRVQAAGDPTALWHRLAGEAGEAEILASEQLAERYSHQSAIANAVEHQLIPSLRVRVREVWGAIDPLALFRGIDAVALLVRAFPDPDEPTPDIVLRHGSEVWVHDACAIPRSTIEAEVARSTSTSADGRGASGRGVMPAATVPRFVQWLPQAARDNENLFLGIRSAPRGRRDAALTIIERDNAANLDSHWWEGNVSRARRDLVQPRRSPLATPLAVEVPSAKEAPSSGADRPGVVQTLDTPWLRAKQATFRSTPSPRDDHLRHTPTKPLPAMKSSDLDDE